MRRLSASILPLAALGLLLSAPAIAREEIGQDLGTRLINASMLSEARSAPPPPGAPVPETTFVGFRPGKVSASNYWGIGKGNFRVYSSDPADYGYWGWDNDGLHDNIAEVHGDSLFGWWPLRLRMNGTAAQVRTDDNRPWWAIDIGNNVNYVINQGAAHQRTFGVAGVWHRDNGSAGGGGVSWKPLNGSTHSLWCGLRRDGDDAFLDPLTGNPFDSRPLTLNPNAGGTTDGGIGTDHLFPGYGSQWDQMAYRDLDVEGATTLSVRFRYRTNMSTGRITAPDTRTGWFDKDPLQATFSGAAAGNFISSSAAGDAGAPIDSFMVYVGAPVVDSLGMAAASGGEWFLASDGVVRRVHDVQRRWFSEVLRVNEGRYREIFTTFGDHAEQTVEVTGIPLAGASAGNRARLVFRSKTNRGFDDEGGSAPGAYSSNGAGAVVLDDVEVALDGGGYQDIGDFEQASDVDNRTEVSPLDAWKSTGKPPAVYHHVHDSSDLIYEDRCGPVNGRFRVCNMTGNVISSGDHDESEAAGGFTSGTAESNRYDGFFSPTVNLRNGGGVNAMDIDAAIATVTEDYYLVYDVYTGVFDFLTTGNTWRGGFAAYPATQRDGHPTWSDFRLWPFVLFNPDKQCFQDLEPGLAFGLLRWNSALAEGGVDYPDSIRMLLHKRQECYRFAVSTGCSPTDGAYFDNVSLAFVDGDAPPLSVDIADWINDTFPVNGLNRGANPLNTAAFDTTSALVKTGRNIAQSAGNSMRYAIPGDTTVISALGDHARVDLVFRINPGPGNYTALGNNSTSLRRVPTSTTPVDLGAPTGHNFWEEYLADNGARGTPAGHPADAHVNGGKRWSPLVWNSARCDTAEINLYTLSARGIGVPAPGLFATMYEETDPKFATLGLAKNRCFLRTATAALRQSEIVCDLGQTDGWPLVAGYAPEHGLPPGQTYEYTKIFPDGQFTPGTHVQYFIRREDEPAGGGPFLVPDTMRVFPQPREGSTDAHRWQQFGVLPDGWKKGAYGGLGQACVLYVDLNDRRGNERVWVSIADSNCSTASYKFGAHNGWFSSGGRSVNDPAGFIAGRNEQPGTTWDMYGVKASESLNHRVAGIGANYAFFWPPSAASNKRSFQAPSIDMLEAFYKMVVILTGDQSSGVFGPYEGYGPDDVRMLQEFMAGGLSGYENHRGVFVQGEGVVESMQRTPSNQSLLAQYFHAALRDPSYLLLTGNIDPCVLLEVQAPISAMSRVHGIRNGCLFLNDVLMPHEGSVPSSLYSPAGNASEPVVAGVFHDVDVLNGEFWLSVVDGWDVENLATHCWGKGTIGRRLYYYDLMTNIFSQMCQISGLLPVRCPFLDVPNAGDARALVDFMNLRNNPLVSGRATVDFGLSKADRVEVKVYDVSGRLVRTLADRMFAPGNHSLVWDGADSAGRQVARGVYFTQVRFAERGFAEARKLTVLR